MTRTVSATLLTLLLFPAAAGAQLSVGLRAGYAIPSGDLQQDLKLSDQLKSSFPIQLDLLYRVAPRTAAGLYASFGLGQIASALKERSELLVGPGASYRAATWRIGVEATQSFLEGPIVPWVGIGSGIEIGTYKVENGGATIKGSTRGWEWINLQAGGDYLVSPRFAAGIYVAWSIGQFTYQGGEVSGTGFLDGSTGGGLGADAATHQWLGFGVRGRFDL